MEGDIASPRAADDFPAIRARMEELRRERGRPRAADDFPAIRARMEELRRERAQISAKAAGRTTTCPRHEAHSDDPRLLRRSVSRKLSG
jgi:hypothetical protein